MSPVNPVIRPLRRRSLAALAACVACVVVVVPIVGRAEDTPDSAAQAGARTPSPSAMVSLINRLAARGVLTKQDQSDLVGLADADAADARVEAAEIRLAAAKAEAAAARARVQLSMANSELALAKATATRLAANQAAAVRLLLGQGQGGASAPTGSPASDAPESAAAGPAVAISDANAGAAQPDESAAASAAAAMVSTPEAQPSSQATVAMEASPAPTTVVLTRNEDGAVVVPEDPKSGQAPSSSAAPEATEGDQPAAEPSVEPAPPAAPKAVASSAAPDTTEGDQTAPEPAVEPAPKAVAAPGAADLTRNDEGAVVVPEEGQGGQAASETTLGNASDGSAAPAKDTESDLRTEAPKPEDTGGDVGQVASAPSAAPASAAETAPTEAAGASAPSGDESVAVPEATASPEGSAGPPRTAAEAPVGAAEAAPAGGSAAESGGSSDDVVRVSYVPEIVKREIREEVKNEVIAEARKENWGSPSSGPEWVSRFTLYGDIRVRAEEVINHSGNDDTGSFPNFNAINTGAPFDTAGSVFSPQYNVDQNRNRERLRARLGAAVVISDGFTAGVRIATGNDNQPVSENQTFGAAGNAQGGDFSKYSLWLDRAFIRYQSGGDPGDSFWMSFGRFDNPFFSTSLIWANEIGFDGFVANVPLKAHLSGHPNEDFKPYIVGGAFPVFNTDLNYATNQPAKFKSYDKWLYAAQIGFDAKLSGDYQLKAAAALYDFNNIQGQVSSPFTPLTTSDAGDTDASRPSWAQNGNTYIALRNITPGPLNDNGTIDQFQYYGLATPFKEFAVTEGLYYNHFEPFQISLVSEWVKNLAFNRASVAANAVNNGGSADFIGGNVGWMSTLKFGNSVIKDLGDWNASIGYRRVETDAVVDGFNDADFGGVLFGTNLKGYTLSADVGLAPDVWLEAHWMSASAIAGPTFKNDLLQLDLNAKF